MYNKIVNAINGFKNSNPYHYDRGTQSYATGNIDYISTIASMTPSDFITCNYEVLSNLEIVNPVVKRYINQPVDDAFKDGFYILIYLFVLLVAVALLIMTSWQ